MEEEIDLRQYVAVLIRYQYWVAGVTILAAVLAFIISSFMPRTYAATTLVTARQQAFQLQFDARVQNIPEWSLQPWLQSQYRTYPTLAMSDNVLEQTAKQAGWNPAELKRAADAEASSDPSLVKLVVKGKDAAEVARVANIWADVFVISINTIYGTDTQPEQFKQQQENIAQSLAKADAALTAFREQNGFGFYSSETNRTDFGNGGFSLIGQRLQAKNKLLTDYEAELVRVQQMQQEVELLSTTTTTSTSPVLVAGLLSEMINNGIIQDTPPYQIKLESVDPVAGLAAMDRALKSRITAIETAMEPVRADIAALQAELAAKQEKLEQLTRDRDVMNDTYGILSRKVQEIQLETLDHERAKVASQAMVPIEPVSPRRLLNTAIAGAVGFILGVVGVFAREWWRNPGR